MQQASDAENANQIFNQIKIQKDATIDAIVEAMRTINPFDVNPLISSFKNPSNPTETLPYFPGAGQFARFNVTENEFGKQLPGFGNVDVYRIGSITDTGDTTPDVSYDDASSPPLLANPTATDKIAVHKNMIAVTSASGLSLIIEDTQTPSLGLYQHITTAYNTGKMPAQAIRIWQNSVTVDRSKNGATFVETGAVTLSAFVSGSEINGMSGFSPSNHITEATSADFNSIGTNDVWVVCGFKSTGDGGYEQILQITDPAGATSHQIALTLSRNSGSEAQTAYMTLNDGTTGLNTGDDANASDIRDGQPHVAFGTLENGSGIANMNLDGYLVSSDTDNAFNSLSVGTLTIAVGIANSDKTSNPAALTTIAFLAFGTGLPTQNQIEFISKDLLNMMKADFDGLLSTSNTLKSVTFDQMNDDMIVGEDGAMDTFIGSERTASLTTSGTPTDGTMNNVGASGGIKVYETDSEAGVQIPAKTLLEELTRNYQLIKDGILIPHTFTGTAALETSIPLPELAKVSSVYVEAGAVGGGLAYKRNDADKYSYQPYHDVVTKIELGAALASGDVVTILYYRR